MSVDNLSQTLPLHWAYLNEGRAAAVFSYRGPLDSPFAHKVLRLRKSSSSDPGDDPDNDPIIAFHSSLISRLFIPDLLPRYRLLAIDHEWLTSFAAFHDPSRPPDRRATAGIDLFRHSAVLADDLVSTYPCSFEIKPKWGFLPSPSLLSPSTAPIKTQTCRTCMHDHLRRTNAAATEAGLERPAGPDTVKLGSGSPAPDLDPEPDYCALDLFSRDPARVRRAVRALWAIWTSDLPTNKLRIFARGRMLDPTDHQGVATWATETWGALKPQTLDAVKTEEAVCDTLADALLSSGVLTRLADLQRMFDPLDIEGLARLRDAVHAPGETPPILDEPTLEEWHATVDRMLERARATAEDGDLIEQADAETWRFYARAYMLSATLKDCSIFVALPDGGGDPIVKLVDLDPKSVAKFGYWEQLDEEVVDAYREVEEGKRKVCVDDRGGVDERKAGKAGK